MIALPIVPWCGVNIIVCSLCIRLTIVQMFLLSCPIRNQLDSTASKSKASVPFINSFFLDFEGNVAVFALLRFVAKRMTALVRWPAKQSPSPSSPAVAVLELKFIKIRL